MKFFDTHCHLSGKALRDKASEIAQRAQKQNVTGLCLIASNEEDLEPTAECASALKKEFPQINVCFTSGIHPHEADTYSDEYWNRVVAHAEHANAIGETGLDFFYDFADRNQQISVFQKHIDLSIQTQKPLVIHCRNSAHEILEQLEQSKVHTKNSRPGILHCFTENQSIANACLDLGLMISFSGILSFKNATELRDVAAKIPLERLLIETDSPYLAPVPYRGKENEPAFVVKTFEALMAVRTETPEVLSQALWDNACKIYNS